MFIFDTGQIQEHSGTATESSVGTSGPLSPSQSLYQSSVPILILLLLLSEGQAAETWEPSKECHLG
jgi:hypothetical protein